MYYFEDIINEIEKNILCEIDIKDLSQKAGMSIYEFRRIFSFITKIPIGEYIRKRRLSLAALELYEGKGNVTELAIKYGYGLPASFSRAFKEFHGVTPYEVINGYNNFKLLTKVSAEIVTSGSIDITYSIFQKDSFTVSGFKTQSPITDTECCENVWNSYYKSELADELAKTNDRIYAVYKNGDNFVECYIGQSGDKYPSQITIPQSMWASFDLCSTDDQYVNKFYKDVLKQWLSSSGYTKNNDLPNIEVFPADMETDGFAWQIWIPVKKETL